MPLASGSRALGVVLLAVIARADTPTGKPAPPMTADERLLQAAYLDHTGPTLLSFFRRQSEAQVDPKELQALIAELGKALPSLHRPAAGKLIALGAPAAPALREVANNLDDTE